MIDKGYNSIGFDITVKFRGRGREKERDGVELLDLNWLIVHYLDYAHPYMYNLNRLFPRQNIMSATK